MPEERETSSNFHHHNDLQLLLHNFLQSYDQRIRHFGQQVTEPNMNEATESQNLTQTTQRLESLHKMSENMPLSPADILPPDVQNFISASAKSFRAASIISALLFAGGSMLLSIQFTSPFTRLTQTFYGFGFIALFSNVLASVIGWIALETLYSLPNDACKLAIHKNTSLPYILKRGADHISDSGWRTQYLRRAKDQYKLWFSNEGNQDKFLTDMGLKLRWRWLLWGWRLATVLGVASSLIQLGVYFWILGHTVICSVSTGIMILLVIGGLRPKKRPPLGPHL